jgi:hypothetical protein
MRIILCYFGKTESVNSGRTSFCDWPVKEVKVLFILDIIFCALPGEGKCTILDSRQSIIMLIHLIPKVHSFLIGWIYHNLIIRYLPVSEGIISTPKWTVKFNEFVSDSENIIGSSNNFTFAVKCCVFFHTHIQSAVVHPLKIHKVEPIPHCSKLSHTPNYVILLYVVHLIHWSPASHTPSFF